MNNTIWCRGCNSRVEIKEATQDKDGHYYHQGIYCNTGEAVNINPGPTPVMDEPAPLMSPQSKE
jgi:hypothetical protein